MSAYYRCGGYVASGVAFCDTPRIPTEYLEDAVLEGIQKRLDPVLDVAELGRRLDERLADDDAGGAAIPSWSRTCMNKKKRQAILRWYRPPRDASVKLVAVGGIEPPTRGL